MWWRIREVYRGIKRLFAYAPIIYKSEDWDYEYLNDLISFKLKRMEKVIRNGYCVNSHTYANQIKHVYTLLDEAHGKNIFKQHEDVKRAYKLMSKNILNWWD